MMRSRIWQAIAFQSGFEGTYWITVQNVSPYLPRTNLVVDLVI